MPAPAAGPEPPLAAYRALIDRIDRAARRLGAPDGADACGSCRSCCGPLSLLPVEAYALLAGGLLDGVARPVPDGCPALEEGGCRLADARPFACRVRALPSLHLDAAGDWTTTGCALGAAPGPAGAAAAPVAAWAAELHRIDREFRVLLDRDPGRTSFGDLARAPSRYRALLSPAAGRRLASRAPA